MNAGNPDQKMLQVGGVFDFKFLKVHAAYADQNNISAVAVANWGHRLRVAGRHHPGGRRQLQQPGLHGWPDGSAVRRQPLRLVPVVGCEEHRHDSRFSFEPDYNVWGVGYTYPFSRRTNMYVAYGQRKWDGNITNVVVPVTGPLANAAQIVDTKQFTLGIRHLF